MQFKPLFKSCLEILRAHSFQKSYDEYFSVVQATTPQQLDQVFRIRYAVYCAENGLIAAAADAGGLERDVYDARSKHSLLIHKPSGRAVGTVRVVLPDEQEPEHSFPLQEVCDHPFLAQTGRMTSVCEISRLCMIKDFRRRARDGRILPAYYSPDDNEREGALVRRVIPYAPLGLLQAAFESALKARILDCLCVLDFEQLHTLEAMGMKYRVLGPQLGYLGQQQPVIFNIKNALDNMAIANKGCWEIVSDGGRLHKMANRLSQEDWEDHLFGPECHDLIIEKLSEKSIFS